MTVLKKNIYEEMWKNIANVKQKTQNKHGNLLIMTIIISIGSKYEKIFKKWTKKVQTVTEYPQTGFSEV